MIVLGVDIGGTGIKAAPVNIKSGEMLTERYRIPTPDPATPEAVIDIITEIVTRFNHQGEIGVGFPGPIVNGVIRTAVNLDQTWVGLDGDDLITQQTGCPTIMINDADAAGLAEMRFGAGKNSKGVVLVITLGTGIGTGLFVDGKLLPNTELGHIYLRNKKRDAEYYSAESARIRKKMSWKAWAKELDAYLWEMNKLFWMQKVIIGGGASKKHEKFVPLLTIPAEVVPAEMGNNAGIIGAALAVLNS